MGISASGDTRTGESRRTGLAGSTDGHKQGCAAHGCAPKTASNVVRKQKREYDYVRVTSGDRHHEDDTQIVYCFHCHEHHRYETGSGAAVDGMKRKERCERGWGHSVERVV